MENTKKQPITFGIIGARCSSIANYDYRLYEYKKIISNITRILKRVDKNIGIKTLYTTNYDGIGQLTYMALQSINRTQHKSKSNNVTHYTTQYTTSHDNISYNLAPYPYNIVTQKGKEYLYSRYAQIRQINRQQMNGADNINCIYTNNVESFIYSKCDFILILDSNKNKEMYEGILYQDNVFYINIKDMKQGITLQLNALLAKIHSTINVS